MLRIFSGDKVDNEKLEKMREEYLSKFDDKLKYDLLE